MLLSLLRKKTSLILFCIAFLLQVVSQKSWGQITKEFRLQHINEMANALENEGFQNISIYQLKEDYVVAYENRKYRFEATALKRVLQVSADIAIKDTTNIIFITKRNNVPIVSTHVSLKEYTAYKKGFLKDDEFAQSIAITQEVSTINGTQPIIATNTGNYQLELVLRPYFSVELGNRHLADQFIHLFDVRPKLNFYLWKGAHFTYEFILPISNEFKEQAPHWGKIRPRIIALSQQVRLPYDAFLTASIGVFSRSRYGMSTELGKYFLNGKALITGRMGYTGHASYIRYNGDEVTKGWLYAPLDYIDYKVGMHYWFPKRNTQMSLEYGKVLSERKMVRFTCTQKIREKDIGFFVFKTDQGTNYGMQLNVPLVPRKYWRSKWLSIRPSKQFQYEYIANTNLAREYQSQGMYEGFPQDLNPAFLQLQLLDLYQE